MSTIVYRIAVLLSALLAEVPVGTNLGLFWLLWALISGRFLRSRGAVFPALADGGLPADAVRRSGAALASGRWAIQHPSRGHGPLGGGRADRPGPSLGQPGAGDEQARRP